jgi:hypothetical protein
LNLDSRNVELLRLEALLPSYMFLMRMVVLYLTENSDIDMVVNWPGHTWTNPTMRQIARQIERNGIGRSFQYIFSARVRFPCILIDV